MKRINILILIVTMALAIGSCKKDEKISPKNSANVISNGKWRISYFNDSGKDETNHFTGFTFTFNDNNTISASNGSSTINGTWNTRKDDGVTKLDLNFGSTPVFDDLNDDWKIQSQSDKKIELTDVSGGGSGTDYLTFEKI